MVWVALAVFPQISVAVQIRVMVYLFTHAPAVITSVTVTVTLACPVQLSVAVTEAIWPTGTSDAQLYVAACGTPEITGAV